MINFDAISKITYGLYVVCSGNREKGNGYVCNTVNQVTSKPVKVSVCCNKDNYTAELIKTTGVLSVSVLPETVSPEIIGTFGYQSGRDIEKFKNFDFDIRYGYRGVPVLYTDAIATLECEVEQTVDVGTHLLFVCEVREAALLKDAPPITYDYYRKVKKGIAPKNAPTFVESV